MLFKIPPQDLNSMMLESTEIIVKLLESPDPISYKGKYWNIDNMALQLRSYQQPRLKLATASVGSPRSLDFAARYEMLLFSLAGGTAPNTIPLSNQWDEVEKSGKKYGTNPKRDDFRIVTYMHLADTNEEAWADVENGIVRDVHEYFYTINSPKTWLMTPDQNPSSLTAREIAKKRRWIIGTPDEAISQIEALYEETGGFGGLMLTTHEWTPQSKIKYSLELLARYVMPHFRGHTTDLKKEWSRTKSNREQGKIPD